MAATKFLTVRLDVDTLDSLGRLAVKERRTRSQLVRMLIEDRLSEEEHWSRWLPPEEPTT